MPRIRSIHPEQWCDEDFVELSLPARLLVIGLRNFCDDKGVFEWKPKTIKMKVFPADNFDCGDLLKEIERAGMVKPFTAGGKEYGAVRNFCKFQKPKKPNDIYPITEAVAQYVAMPTPKAGNESGAVPASGETGGEPVGNQDGNSPPDGVGVGVGEDTSVSSSAKKPRRKSCIPEDAVISDAMMRAADKRGLSLQEAEAQFQKFKNDALAKGKTFVDWDRAFVTWLDSPYFRPALTAIEGGRNGNGTFGRSGPAGGRSGHPEAFDAVALAARLGTTQG